MDTRTLFDLTADNLKNDITDKNKLGAGTIINFARTSKRFHTLFQEEYQQALPFLKKAFNHAVCGEWDDLDQLLQLFPDLLTCRATIQLRGRHRFEDRKIWQIALMNEEGDNERVRSMFEKHFKRLPHGLEEMREQFSEVFPDGQMNKYPWDIEIARKLLNNTIGTILKDQTLDDKRPPFTKMHDVTRAALKAFHDYVTPAPSKKFTTGLICDARLFSDIIRQYREKLSEFNRSQRLVYGVQLWDYFVRLLPTGYLRPLCQGTYFIVAKNVPLTVNGCVLRSGEKVLPLDLNPDFVFGRHCILAGLRESVFDMEGRFYGCQSFEEYVEQKEQATGILRNIFTTAPSPAFGRS